MSIRPIVHGSVRPAFLLIFTCMFLASACKPDDSGLKVENEQLRKQVGKQESVILSLQDGTKVMQQQIDLLNQELRDAKKIAGQAQTDLKEVQATLGRLETEKRQLRAKVEQTEAKMAQVAKTLQVDDTGGQSQELLHPIEAVTKATEEALSQHGYAIQVGVKTDRKAVYLTNRKTSASASLEVSGFRNQYLVALHRLPSSGTLVSVKADFEKTAKGGCAMPVGKEETADIERRLIGEISNGLASPKTKTSS